MFIVFTWLKESIKSLFRNLWWNSMVVFLSTLCLLFFAVSFVAGMTMENLANQLDNKVEVKMDLLDSVANYEEIQTQLEEMPQTKEVVFVSKQEAYTIMQKEMGEDAEVLEILEENPFPARFVVKLHNPEQVEDFVKEIKTYNITESIQYGEGHINKLLDMTRILRNIGFIGAIIGTIMAIAIVMSVIKINVTQRRKEIEIKELVGASMLTIRVPFILEAVILTGLSSLLIYIAFFFGYQFLIEKIATFVPNGYLISLDEVLSSMFLPLISLGIGIGAIGGFFSTNKMIKRY